jgi:hypothetical protein
MLRTEHRLFSHGVHGDRAVSIPSRLMGRLQESIAQRLLRLTNLFPQTILLGSMCPGSGRVWTRHTPITPRERDGELDCCVVFWRARRQEPYQSFVTFLCDIRPSPQDRHCGNQLTCSATTHRRLHGRLIDLQCLLSLCMAGVSERESNSQCRQLLLEVHHAADINGLRQHADRLLERMTLQVLSSE